MRKNGKQGIEKYPILKYPVYKKTPKKYKKFQNKVNVAVR